MNTLNLLNENEKAMIAAGVIYWAYNEKRQKRYFVPGSSYEYTTYEGARGAAIRNGIIPRMARRLNINAARAAALAEHVGNLRAQGQSLITNFFEVSGV